MQRFRSILHHLHPLRVTQSLYEFLRDESVGGKIVVAAAVLSVIVVNSPLEPLFHDFWSQTLSLGIGTWTIELSFLRWVNEGLMALFFLVVGLEIKRELIRGELREKNSALLPIVAAIGGVIVPAVIYVAFTFNTPVAHGWGIPISTDTAIAIAILGLLRHHIPIQLKIFLLALAVTDDIIAISVITLFYSGAINLLFLVGAISITLFIYIMRKYLSTRLFLVIILGVALWLTTYASGVHASVVGVIMGLLAPIPPRGQTVSTPEKVERFFLPLTSLFVVPLFAFANAGVVLSAKPFQQDQHIILAIIAGLVIGKVLGITTAAWLLVKSKKAELPENVDWSHVIGVSFIAGIGFTMSLFIAELTFEPGSAYIDSAKIGIFIASIISAVIGMIVLRTTKKSADSD